jgi:hypothetical protein
MQIAKRGAVFLKANHATPFCLQQICVHELAAPP